MRDPGTEPVVVLCRACGVPSVHHHYVKPLCPLVGLVCSRCGHVLPLRGRWAACKDPVPVEFTG
jgi:hypothetical protein